ncbi:MAG: YkgJ family cysteine cluster protein [Thermodesulfovibrionales bacterium]|nr:YkgJ family cysteine cluster protein [Thermodesulfovibrionales bacterium]
MNDKNSDKEQILSLNDTFRFSCHKGISCFNICCRDVNIFLTPYDVLRMSEGTDLSSTEFLKKYTITLLTDEGLPLVVLKMLDDESKSCPFVSDEGCSIYLDRPWSCRMYPLFSSEEGYLLKEKPSCLGFQSEKQWTIAEWKRAQGINDYDKMNDLYKSITSHEYFQKGNRLDAGRARMLYKACYDIDEFNKFIFKTRFFDIYDIEEEIIDKIYGDKEELLKFAILWVKFILFSDGMFKLKDESMNKLLQEKNRE